MEPSQPLVGFTETGILSQGLPPPPVLLPTRFIGIRIPTPTRDRHHDLPWAATSQIFQGTGTTNGWGERVYRITSLQPRPTVLPQGNVTAPKTPDQRGTYPSALPLGVQQGDVKAGSQGGRAQDVLQGHSGFPQKPIKESEEQNVNGGERETLNASG